MNFLISYKYFIMSIIYLVSFSLCLELFSRLFFYISEKDILAFKKYPGRYKNSYFSGYGLSPNWSLENNGLKETINSYGLRSPEFQFKKNKDTYRIICLGSSVVYGRGNDDETFPFQLEEKLNNMNLNGVTFEVINAGIPGYTSYHTSTQLLTSLIDLKPDLVISYQLFNELWYYFERNNEKMNSQNFHSITNISSYERILDKSYFLTIINSISRKYKSQISDNNDILNQNEIIENTRIYDDKVLHYYKRNINFMAMACEYLDITLILSTPLSLYKEKNTEEEKKYIYDHNNKDFYLKLINEGNKILNIISKKHDGVYYFNPSNYIKSNLSTLEDRYHPTSLGNALIGEEYKKLILNLNLMHRGIQN